MFERLTGIAHAVRYADAFGRRPAFPRLSAQKDVCVTKPHRVSPLPAGQPGSPLCAGLFGDPGGVEQGDPASESAMTPAPDRSASYVAEPNAIRFPARIETQRLTLRRPVAGDFATLRSMASDPTMFRYSARQAMIAEESWGLLLRHIGHWDIAGYGVYTVLERETGRFVGQVGASSFQRDLGEEFDPHPEMTWTIASAHRGQGYATEAAAAFLEVLDHQEACHRSVCLIHIDNQASLRVANKLGFRFYRRHDYRDYPAGLFRR